jgi:hypothetical protein
LIRELQATVVKISVLITFSPAPVHEFTSSASFSFFVAVFFSQLRNRTSSKLRGMNFLLERVRGLAIARSNLLIYDSIVVLR